MPNFKKNALEKIGNVAQEGRTVLLVSHNMTSIEQNCTSAILINKGEIVLSGKNVSEIVDSYVNVSLIDNKSNQEWENTNNQFNNPYFIPLTFKLIKEKTLNDNDDLCVEIEAEINQLHPALIFGYALYNEKGETLYWSLQTDLSENKWPLIKPGHSKFRSKIPLTFLNNGEYVIELIAGLYYINWICAPSAQNSPKLRFDNQRKLSESPHWTYKRPGIMAPKTEWVSVENVKK